MQTELFEKNALLVTRSDEQILLYTDILSANGFAVKSILNTHSINESLTQSTDLVLIDYADDVINEIQERIKELNRKIPVVYISIDDNISRMDNCIALHKPILIDDLLAAVHNVVYCNDNEILDPCIQTQRY